MAVNGSADLIIGGDADLLAMTFKAIYRPRIGERLAFRS
jgi:predicted nucleic acid-binding protein